MRRIIDLIIILTSPSYWLMNYKYSEIWDKELNMLMSKNIFKVNSTYRHYDCELGGKIIWVSNHPYASFTSGISGEYVRASRLTIIKAKRKYDYDILDTDIKRNIALNKLIGK